MRTIVLPARIDRTVTATLVPELLDAVGAGALVLDGSKVDRAGQSALQLLLSARMTAASLGFTCTIQPSDQLRDAIRLTGLETHLLERPST